MYNEKDRETDTEIDTKVLDTERKIIHYVYRFRFIGPYKKKVKERGWEREKERGRRNRKNKKYVRQKKKNIERQKRKKKEIVWDKYIKESSM